nr:tetratricopeptide repeat protein [Novosphingobium sp. B 225]
MHKPILPKPLLALVLALAAPATPALAQSTSDSAEVRIRKLEAEIAALQRAVFPGGDGKYFAPLVQSGAAGTTTTTGTPASTPITDLLARMDAVEAQLARLTAQQEVSGNKIVQLEARVAALSASNAAAVTDTPPAANPAASPAVTVPKPVVTTPAITPPALAPKPAVTTPAATTKPATPSAQRLAAVKAVEKPATADAGDDEYSYGYRLWEKKFYPEAEQQLKLFLQKYPKHTRVSYARNLLGRAYLDEGNPREAASWFLQNYQAGKKGDRAPDSLLFLAESMRQLKDSNRACVALSQFADDYPAEAAGRLKAQYDATRAGTKCN